MTQTAAINPAELKVLNVGGNSKAIPIPAHYNGWAHHLLDIDPRGKPDVLCDARELTKYVGDSYDAIYCSHNLEHYFAHDVSKVLAGFMHVLKPHGFAEIRVPDMGQLFRLVIEKNLDIDDVIYVSKAGPITVKDTIYGFGKEIAQTGQDFYAHKTGFTHKSLRAALGAAGFRNALQATSAHLEIRLIALKGEISAFHRTVLNIKDERPATSAA